MRRRVFWRGGWRGLGGGRGVGWWGGGAECVVAVVMERSVLLVTVLVGVLKSGAAYVPVDPGYPAERVAGMLADACPVVVVTSAAVAGVVAGLGVGGPGVGADDLPVRGGAGAGVGGGGLRPEQPG